MTQPRRWLAFPLVAVCLLWLGMSSLSQEPPGTTPPAKPDSQGYIQLKSELESTRAKLKAAEEAALQAKQAAADARKAAADAAQEIAALKATGVKVEATLAEVKETATRALKSAETVGKSTEKLPVDAAPGLPTNDANTSKEATATATTVQSAGDIAWMLAATALVMFMIPGLALFYGGMARRKNVLATMMQSMAALAVVGVYWAAIGYALAFGPSKITISVLGVENGGIIGFSPDLIFLKGIPNDMTMPGLTIPVYLHMAFQGMFAILTPALISGAIAERIRFWPYCLFMILWITVVYCPLAHMVWAFDNFDPAVPTSERGSSAIGLFGKLGALDFAGGTVVHIAAGLAGLACCLVLGKRDGYPKTIAHPNSMVLTLLGAGLLWFGWFGFNGGSALASNSLAASALTVTQFAAAAAGLGWMLMEWLHRGKPTALGLASGFVAGLVAITPAAGAVAVWGAVPIGLIAAAVCYAAVMLKGSLGYDDTLDAFGVHGVGGFVGAVLTGVFWTQALDPENAVTRGGLIVSGSFEQTKIQFIAAIFAVCFAFVASLILCQAVQWMTRGNFRTSVKDETTGLDQTEHGESGFDFGYATESFAVTAREPKSAIAPKGNGKFVLTVEGVAPQELMKAWSGLCQPSDAPIDGDFLAVYPFVTTVAGTNFSFRGGDPATIAQHLTALFRKQFPGKPVVTRST
jgi:Amt family ammonium transporter